VEARIDGSLRARCVVEELGMDVNALASICVTMHGRDACAYIRLCCSLGAGTECGVRLRSRLDCDLLFWLGTVLCRLPG
jgi:hypothetical protein